MTENNDPIAARASTSENVSVCRNVLNDTLVRLALQYGAATAVAALTELAGCATCAVKDRRREHIRSLIRTVGGPRA
jgi:hypothetical protein